MQDYDDDAPGSSWHDGERWTVSQRGDWDDFHEWSAAVDALDAESYPTPDDGDDCAPPDYADDMPY